MQYGADESIVGLSDKGEDEKAGGAGDVPLGVHATGVDGSSVAHEQELSHDSQDHAHLWMVLPKVEDLFLGN